MDKLYINQTGGFPLTTNILNAMQNAYNVFNVLGNLAGNFTIISGCVETGSNVSDGVVFVNGEVLPFKGGTKISKVRIVEVTEGKQFENGETKAVLFKRYVEFGTGIDAINWSEFKRLNTILQIMQRLTELENDPDDTVLPATQAEVTTGIVENKYVSPKTLPKFTETIIMSGEVSSSGTRISYYKKFFTSSRIDEGTYRINHNIGHTKYGCVGGGVNSGTLKVAISQRFANYCVVMVSDDHTTNDGGFSFQIFKTSV